MNKLIGVIGLKRSGKDTISDYLCKNYAFEKYSLAEPLKRGCMEIFGFTEYQVFDEGKDIIDPVWGCTPRDILKVMGTEVAQYDLQKYIPSFVEVGRNIWVRRFEQWYQKRTDITNESKVIRKPHINSIVIADVRFKHEAKSVVKMGGEIWRVDRPGMDVGDFHASEMEIFEIPYKHLITNDGTLEDLYNKIDDIRAGIFK